MLINRRKWLLLGSGALIANALPASAQSLTYTYDEFGRLKTVTYPNGFVSSYAYDNAGNRTQVTRAPNEFSGAINVPSGGPVNLRSLANAAGYDGAKNATITFVVAASATVTGAAGASAAAGGIAIDTGTWPTSSYTIALTLQIAGKVYGGGGGGGRGGGQTIDGTSGGSGGDAIYARVPLSVSVLAGGEVRGGGGGGGGGGAWWQDYTSPRGVYSVNYLNGGGGGGGFPNGAAGLQGYTTHLASIDVANDGLPGTVANGGAGGTGGTALSHTTGAGGAGGGIAIAGTTGATSVGGTLMGWSINVPGSGGGAGYAIRKNAQTVSVVSNGSISGTVA